MLQIKISNPQMFEEYFSITAKMPKYQILIEALYASVRDGKLKKGDQIPSINTICQKLSVSRDTVLTAFKELKAKGVINSVSGKGYYLASERTTHKDRIFLLFDEFNSFKEDIYNAFMQEIEHDVEVDIFFHHFHQATFSALIDENVGKYSRYIIMPGSVSKIENDLCKLPPQRTYLLDRKKNLLSNKYITVYQNFYKGTLKALSQGQDLFKKYQKLVLVYPGGKEPIERKKAVVAFCQAEQIALEIVTKLSEAKIEKSVAYLVHSDRTLIKLIKASKQQKLKLGTDIGLISFNDTELKEVVADGITTISADFKQMGKVLAETLSCRHKENTEIPTTLIKRRSF